MLYWTAAAFTPVHSLFSAVHVQGAAASVTAVAFCNGVPSCWKMLTSNDGWHSTEFPACLLGDHLGDHQPNHVLLGQVPRIQLDVHRGLGGAVQPSKYFDHEPKPHD